MFPFAFSHFLSTILHFAPVSLSHSTPPTPVIITLPGTDSNTSQLTRQLSRNISAIPVPAISIPQTSFAPGILPSSISPPASPLTSQASKARQRRVSSVSSSHSIRQVGTYGGGSRVPMMSPARKANPYYSGVIARFSNGGRHSLHDRDHSSSSSKRRSVVAVGGERARVGADPSSSRDKLTMAEATGQDSPKPTVLTKPRPLSTASTASSIVSEAKEREPLPALPSHQESTEESDDEHKGTSRSFFVPSSVQAPLMFTPTYEEEYDIEKDSIRNSIRGSPFFAKATLPYTGTVPIAHGPPTYNARSASPPSGRTVPIPPEINTQFVRLWSIQITENALSSSQMRTLKTLHYLFHVY